MFSVELKEPSIKDIQKIDTVNKKRILKKIEFFAAQKDPTVFAVKLVESEVGEYRWRVGVYRIIFDIHGNTLVILRIRHRREVYKK